MPLDLYKTYSNIQLERNGQALRNNVPSPYGGLNTRDSESKMEQTDAIILENFIPGQGSVKSRKGYVQYCSGLTGYVKTLIEHYSGNYRKFLACHENKITDITDPNNLIELGNSYSTGKWEYINFNGYTLLVNGLDNPIKYDGISITSNAISPTGGTASSLNGINIYKNTVFTWNTNQPYFWHGAINAISGTFTKFDLSYVCPNGGNLLKMITVSRDGGSGPDDYAVFIMSNGYAIIYEGNDPSKVTDWFLIGVYKLGIPLSIRSTNKISGDVALLTNEDFILLSTAIKNEGQTTDNTKISGSVIENAQKYRLNEGWEVISYTRGGLLFFNVPVSVNQIYHQYGFNTITGAAFKFTGLNAITWGLFNERLYFGSNGKVYLFDEGYTDNGNYIKCIAQNAFNNLGSPVEKTVNSYRNLIISDGNITLNSIVNFDYGRTSTKQNLSIESIGTTWDIAQWDNAIWSPENYSQNKLIYSSGQGVDLSMRIEVSLKNQSLSWYRTDYSVNLSNIL